MARRNSNGLELSFHKPSGRWLKRGKEFGPTGQRYFGAGKSVHDVDSYKTALSNYRAWQSQQAAVIRQNETFQRVTDVLLALNGHKPRQDAIATFKGIPTAEDIAKVLDGTRADGTDTQAFLIARADQERRRQAMKAVSAMPTPAVVAVAAGERPNGHQDDPTAVGTVCALVDLFDAHNEKRNALRRMNDELRRQGRDVAESKGQALSDESLARIRRYGDRFKALLGTATWDGNEPTARAILEKWKAECERRTNASTGTGLADHDEGVKFAGQLVRFAYESHRLEGLPRNLKTLTQKFNATRNTARAIKLADLHTLYVAAADDMRAWILLGLNCGFYAKDVSDLCGSMIGTTHIDHWRQKTINTAGVNVKYKIWDVTRKTIERSRTQSAADDRVWRTRKGHTLVHHAVASRKRGKTSVIPVQFRKLCIECGIVNEDGKARYDFTNVRDTGTTLIDQIDKTVADVYDAHADKRMAAMYVDKEMVHTGPLDKALVELEKRLNLPTVTPKKPERKKRKRKEKATASAVA